MREDLAVAKLNEKGLGATVHRRPHETVKIGLVYQQGTAPGVRLDKGSRVDIYVSLGPPKVEVPDVMGKSRDDAIAALTAAKLKYKVLTVFSKEDADMVVAQEPAGGRIVTRARSCTSTSPRGSSR
jgi:serine/threonine-protein kinase